MPPELAVKVQRLFAEALKLPASERAAWLDDSSEIPDVIEEVRSLLTIDAKAGDFLALEADGPEEPTAATTWFEENQRIEDEHSSEETIGPYRLLRRLGSGGMGVVYLAARVDADFQKRVALKILRRFSGIDPSELTARFRTERRVLAALEHPNIVSFLDGGQTKSGRLYFTMEYVEGLPIDQFAERNSLSLVDRLKLFQQVCSAVHLAHRNLIVHGDLKPSNILVTPDGVPKLLDFGIAKPLNPDLAARTVFPTRNQRPLTPEFASPEQMLGEPLTTASDIYSLGAVLYLLLCQRRPHELSGLSWPAFEDRVLTRTPELPSTVVARRETETPADSKKWQRLARSLTGDLDTIVLMALRKEPHLRYGSANALSDDITRYLDGLPVLACPPSWRYRTEKFIRKHLLATLALGTIVLLLAAGGLMGWMQSLEIERQRDFAERERSRYREVVLFLEDLFDKTQGQQFTGSQDTAKQILDQGFRLIENSGPPDPSGRAAILETLGTLYLGLGFSEQAEEILEGSVRIHESNFGEEHVWTGATLARLAAAQIDLGKLDSAAEHLDRAVRIQRQTLPADDPVLGETLYEFGRLHAKSGRSAEARAFLEEALDISRRSSSLPKILEARTLQELGKLVARKDPDEGLVHLRSSLAIYRQLANHPRAANVLDDIGSVLSRAGRLDDARAAYRDALSTIQETLGETHQMTAAVHNNLAIVLKNSREYELSEDHYLASIEIYRRLFGDKSQGLANCLNNYAVLLAEQGRDAQAESVLRQALEIYQDSDSGHRSTSNKARTLYLLARSFERHGKDPEQMLQLAHEAAELYESSGLKSPRLARSYELQAEALFALANKPVAIEKLRNAASTYRQLQLDEQSANVHLRLGQTLTGMKRLDEARTELMLALDRSPSEALNGTVSMLLGDVNFLQEAYAESEQRYRSAQNIYLGSGRPDLAATAKARLAELKIAVGEVDIALSLAEEAVETLRSALPNEDFRVADAEGILGSCLAATGRFDEAEPLLLESQQKIQALTPPNARPNPRPLRRLVAFYEASHQPTLAAETRRKLDP